MKQWLVDNWRAKLASLLIAISIWYVIKSHLDQNIRTFPVPGTATTPAASPAVQGPSAEETITSPLTPPPIPGSDSGN